MKFDIITIFPHIFDSYFGESILRRAQESDKIEIVAHNLRDWATDKHKTTDDIPYGGGAGMVMKIEPIYRALQSLMQDQRSTIHDVRGRKSMVRTILFSAKGKKFTQQDAERLAKYDRLIMICGRYEGVDERVAEHLVDEEISIGEYVLTGGEIPAMVVVDSVSRLLPGVLGNEESLREESYSGRDVQAVVGEVVQGGTDCTTMREYPHYTRPEEFNGWKVPEVLLGGNHKEIESWRQLHRKER